MENSKIDVELVELAKSGDKASVALLCEKSMKPAYYIALKLLGNVQDAEDIMSESMLTIVEKIQGLSEPKAYIGWLNRIVVNKCKNYLAKNKPVYMEDEELAELSEEDVEDFNKEFLPEEYAISKEKREILMEVINEKTSYAEKMSVLMFYYNGDSIKTIAAEMNCAEITVKTRLASARRKIKDGIEERFGKGVTLMATLFVLSRALKAEAAEVHITEEAVVKTMSDVKAATEKNIVKTNKKTDKIGKGATKEMAKKGIAGKIAMGVAGIAVTGGLVAGGMTIAGKFDTDKKVDEETKTNTEIVKENKEKESLREAEESYYYLGKSSDGKTKYYANGNEKILTFENYTSIDSEIHYNVTCVSDEDYKNILVDIDGKNITEPDEYTYIGRLNKELFIAKKENDTGVIDYKGNVIVGFDYKRISYEEDYGYGYLMAEHKEGGQYTIFTVSGHEIVSSEDRISSADISIIMPGVEGSDGSIRYKDVIYSLDDGKKIVELEQDDRWLCNMHYSDGKVTAYNSNLEASDVFETDSFFDLLWDYDREIGKIRCKDEEYYYLNEEYEIVELPKVSKTEHILDNGKEYKTSLDEESETLTICDSDGKELCVISTEDVYLADYVSVCGNYLTLHGRKGYYYIDIEKGEFFLQGGFAVIEDNGLYRVMHGSGSTAYYTLFNENFMITFNKDTIFQTNSEGFWAFDDGLGELKSYDLKGNVCDEYSGAKKRYELADNHFIYFFDDGTAKIINNGDNEISWELEFTEEMMYNGYFPHAYLEKNIGIIELTDGFYDYEGELISDKK